LDGFGTNELSPRVLNELAITRRRQRNIVWVHHVPAIAVKQVLIVGVAKVRSEVESPLDYPLQCQITEIGLAFGQAKHPILIMQLFPCPMRDGSEWGLGSRVGADTPRRQMNEWTKGSPL
jgi:hypothetical protein